MSRTERRPQHSPESVDCSARSLSHWKRRRRCRLSINWQPVEVPLLVTPPDVASLDEAHAAIELWEHYSRKRLDLSQRLVVEVLMAQNDNGRWAASTTGREMVRQNGKGDEIEVVEVWGLVQRGEAILHTVHDAVLLASQTQQRMLNVLEGHSDLRRLVKRKWQGTGQQMIEMRNGGQIWYRTRTNGGGRGVDDVDRLVIDEAQHANDEHLAALSPTLLANANPQLNAMGSAGIAGVSSWWWSVRKRALLPNPGRFGYVGHTAERLTVIDGRVVSAPVDLEDRGTWARVNPAVGAGRGGGMAFLEEQRRNLGLAKFAREHLCVWESEPGSAEPGLDAERWSTLADPQADRGGTPSFGVATAPDRSSVAIAVAWRRDDGDVQVMLTGDGDRLDYGRTTAWVEKRAKELRNRWSGRLYPDTASAELIGDSEKPPPRAQVDAKLDDLIAAGRVRHGNQEALNIAVRAAKWRESGEMRVLDRKGDTDITPVKAAALAVWGIDNDEGVQFW